MRAVGHVQRAAVGAKAKALGVAPSSSLGLGLTQIVSTTQSSCVSITLRLSLPALAQHHVLGVGRDGQGRGVQVRDDFAGGPRTQVDHAHAPFAGDVPQRIDADQRALAGGAGQVARGRPPPAPVRHIRLVAHQYDVVRGHAHVEMPHHTAGGGLQFQQAVGEVAAHQQPPAIGADGQAGGDFGHRCTHGPAAGPCSPGAFTVPCWPPEHLYVPFYVAQIDLPAIGREDQARIAHFALGRLFQQLRRDGRRGLAQLSRRQGNALRDLAAGRVENQ